MSEPSFNPLKELEVLYKLADEKYQALCKIYPSLPKSDPRTVSVLHLRDVISPIYLMCSYLEESLKWSEYWNNHDKLASLFSDGHKRAVYNFTFFMTWSGLINNIWTVFEINMVALAKAMGMPDQKDKISIVIPWIRKQLNMNNFQSPFDNFNDLTYLFGLTRNSSHNNGATKQRASLKWREKTYIFEPGKHRDVYLEDCILLVKDLVEVNFLIMTDPVVEKLEPIKNEYYAEEDQYENF